LAKSKRELIASRAAKELNDGMIVNLGIGIPTLVADYIPQDITIVFHGENGILNYGPSPAPGKEDANLCNAGGLPVTVVPGVSYFDSTIAFGMIRRGYLDVTILGALQISETGDLANWIVPGRRVPGMGGAMELAQKAKKVIVLTEHMTKEGKPKILKACSLPLTAKQAVDLIITDMAVIEVRGNGLHLLEVADPFSIADVVAATEAELKIPDSVGHFT
jgi:acetate CoA/acetoacetate CoA-transferase beta subunit